jgi:hypothetical protein
MKMQIFVKVIISIVVIIGLYFAFIYSNDVIDQKIKAAVEVKLKALNIDFPQKLQHSNLVLEKGLEDSIQYIKKIKQTANIIEKIADKTERGLNIIALESGTFALNNKQMPNLSAPDGCEANRGEFNKKVYFDKAFIAPPNVIVSFSVLDFSHGEDHRLRVKVKSVYSDHFVLDFVTWCNTRISQAEINWLAVGY